MADPDPRGWRDSLRRHDVLVFMLATLAVTWVVWVPRATGTPVGVVGQLWTWIPALVALGCAAVLYGRAGVGDLGRRLSLWRVSWWWYPLSCWATGVRDDRCRDSGVARRTLGYSAAARVHPVASCSWVDAADSGAYRRARRGAGLAWIPPATATHPPPCYPCEPDPRALLVAVAPAAGLDCGRHDRGPTAVAALADLLAMSLLFTYVFLGTQGSVLIAIILHASTNLFAVSPSTGPDGDLTVPLVALALKLVLVAALFVRLPRSFSDARDSGPAVFQWSAPG